ncbi:protein kinase family protein [Desulfitobacterium sp.]|uniref:protein kinase family protein n=1 Tax=Desulfitobacterium sp. TaxID=49981 RepID=UPI002C4E045B|nr:protein kinase family protein [Desulfitobacterium sp.]HVJ49741.1 protein kinase family protein [Desulfitobacterium sp.]
MRFYRTLKYAGKKFSQYTIDRLLGEGRYGLCFLARSESGNKVVIKKYKTSLGQKELPNCIDEAVILSKLKDKRIPAFLGVVNEKRFYGFVLEYKNGCTVKELLFKHNYKFTRREVFHTGLQLINIIQYLHENGVVHRDIRIPNVLMYQGKVCLIDFGLARWADKTYRYDLDFSYLGDFLLYLIYSSYEKKEKNKQLPWPKKLPWYEELSLTSEQQLFLRKLLGLEFVYENINDIKTDFIRAFSISRY